MASQLTKKLNEALELEDQQQQTDAISFYEFIIQYKFANEDEINDDTIKAKEQAAYNLAGIFSQKNLFDNLIGLTKQILPLYKDLP